MEAATNKHDAGAAIAPPASEGNKRRCVAIAHSDSEVSKVDQLPDAALVSIATYLSKMSRLQFAAALTAPASSWEKYDYKVEPPEASKIIGTTKSPPSQLERVHPDESQEILRIDGYANYNLQKFFTDVDVGAMLVCANAVNNVKKLKLRYCFGITGRGLEPLRGSTVLEEIVLERVMCSDSNMKTSIISEAAVIPILDSIVEKSGNSLKQISLPKIWCRQPNPVLDQFLLRFNQMMNNRQLPCSVCAEAVRGTDQNPWINNNGPNYGLQNHTCRDCKKQFCMNCEGTNMPHFCGYCQKKVCTGCRTIRNCAGCNVGCCNFCNHFEECQDCHRPFCDCRTLDDYSCVAHTCDICDRTRCFQCVPIVSCETCDRSTCNQCNDNTVNDVRHCGECGIASCSSCLSKEFRERSNDCIECKSRIIPKLLEHIDLLKERIEQLEDV